MDLRAAAPDSPWRPAAIRAATSTAGHSGRENGHCPPRHWRPSKAPHGKTLGTTLPRASSLTSACPSAHRTDGESGMLASWELTLTLGPPPRDPSQSAWQHNAGDWGTPSPALDSTYCPAASRAAKGAAGHSGWENGQGPPSKSDLPRSLCQNAGAHVPSCQRPHLGPPLRSPRTQHLVTASVLGANTNPRFTPSGPSYGVWCRNAGDLGPRAPAPESPCRTVNTRDANGAAGHSGRENGQGPLNPR